MFFVFDPATGTLVSSGSSVADREVLDQKSLAVMEVPDKALPQPWRWNAETREPESYIPPAPPPSIEARLAAIEGALGLVKQSVDRVVTKTGA